MLMPKKTKYRKKMKGRMKGHETRGTKLEFGNYGLIACDPAWITSRQIEAARRAMTRNIKRGGNVWIKIFPDNLSLQNLLKLVWVKVKVTLNTGQLLLNRAEYSFELEFGQRDVAIESLKLAAQKLPIKVKIIEKEAAEA